MAQNQWIQLTVAGFGIYGIYRGSQGGLPDWLQNIYDQFLPRAGVSAPKPIGGGGSSGSGGSGGGTLLADGSGFTCNCKGQSRQKTWAQADSELHVAGWPGPYNHDQTEANVYANTCNS